MESGSTEHRLALTIEPLARDPRQALDLFVARSIRYVQWSAVQPGVRPRELDGSARRDLLATLRRKGLELSGIDLWIPPDHFTDPEYAARALDAVVATINLAEDLERVPISTAIPTQSVDSELVDAISSEAQRRGVNIANHHPEALRDAAPGIGIGIDPASLFAAGRNPADAVLRAGSNCNSARINDLLTTGNRGPIGRPDGQLDVLSYRASLAAIEFAEPVILDCRGWTGLWPGIQQSISAWQNPLPTM